MVGGSGGAPRRARAAVGGGAPADRGRSGTTPRPPSRRRRCSTSSSRPPWSATPEAVAAVCAGRGADLRRARGAEQPAGPPAARRRASERGTPVGVWVERSFDMLIAVLGVLKAGGHYVAARRRLAGRAGWSRSSPRPGRRRSSSAATCCRRSRRCAGGCRRSPTSSVSAIAEPEPPVEALDPASVARALGLRGRAGGGPGDGGRLRQRLHRPAVQRGGGRRVPRPRAVAGRALAAAGARVLEIGNGSGLLLWELASRVAHVTGVDPSPLTQERNRERAAARGDRQRRAADRLRPRDRTICSPTASASTSSCSPARCSSSPGRATWSG